VTFTVLTLFPGLFAGFLGESILARAIERTGNLLFSPE